MTYQEYAKKAAEEERLTRFLDAYCEVTGMRLVVIDSGERPDFVCAPPDASTIGIELTRSPHDYEGKNHDKVWGDGTMDHHDLLAAIHDIVTTKSLKLKEADWRTDQTILVVFLEDYTFDSYEWIKTAGIESDFAECGFMQIWLADCSTIEPFNAVRLIGLHPQDVWGLHQQPSLDGKPFG